MASEPEFRNWLIAKLRQTHWARTRPENRLVVAKRLLLDPLALELAHAQSTNAQALAQRRSGRKTIELSMPEAIYEDWGALCAQRRIASHILFRSAIQALLTTERNPERELTTRKGWRYRGRRWGLAITRGKHWPFRLRTTVSHGAARALSTRATQIGFPAASLLREQVIALLEGRLLRMELIYSADQMWEDETRYYT